jgi:hypothetical protein
MISRNDCKLGLGSHDGRSAAYHWADETGIIQ